MAACMYCPVRIARSRRRAGQQTHMAGPRGVCPVCLTLLRQRIAAGEITEAEAVANSWILPAVPGDLARRRKLWNTTA